MKRASIVLILSLSFPSLLFAAIDEENPEGKVEVYTYTDYDKPYRDRRPNWSWNLAFQYESIVPEEYDSILAENTYKNTFGTDGLTNIQFLFGPKYNTFLGSFGFDILFSRGDTKSTKSGVSRSLSINKTGLAVTYTMDTLMPNPYIAPYVSYQAFTLAYDESGSGDSETGSFTMATAAVAGMLIQLNWMDASAARAGFIESGLQNAYLDFFASQYMPTAVEDLPEFASTNLGAGFRLEF